MTVLLIIFILNVAMAIGQLEIFSKVGYKWWVGLIPVYSTWVLITKIAKNSALWFVLDLIIALLFLVYFFVPTVF